MNAIKVLVCELDHFKSILGFIHSDLTVCLRIIMEKRRKKKEIMGLEVALRRHNVIFYRATQTENLRTVPTIFIAHTFCTSRDTRISYW